MPRNARGRKTVEHDWPLDRKYIQQMSLTEVKLKYYLVTDLMLQSLDLRVTSTTASRTSWSWSVRNKRAKIKPNFGIRRQNGVSLTDLPAVQICLPTNVWRTTKRRIRQLIFTKKKTKKELHLPAPKQSTVILKKEYDPMKYFVTFPQLL